MIALAVRSSAVFVLLCVEQTNRCRVASVGHLVRCPTVQPHRRTGFSHIRQYFHHAISLERAKLDPQLTSHFYSKSLSEELYTHSESLQEFAGGRGQTVRGYSIAQMNWMGSHSEILCTAGRTKGLLL